MSAASIMQGKSQKKRQLFGKIIKETNSILMLAKASCLQRKRLKMLFKKGIKKNQLEIVSRTNQEKHLSCYNMTDVAIDLFHMVERPQHANLFTRIPVITLKEQNG